MEFIWLSLICRFSQADEKIELFPHNQRFFSPEISKLMKFKFSALCMILKYSTQFQSMGSKVKAKMEIVSKEEEEDKNIWSKVLSKYSVYPNLYRHRNKTSFLLSRLAMDIAGILLSVMR